MATIARALAVVGVLLVCFGAVGAARDLVVPDSGSCAGTVIANFPPGSGYSLLCTGSCTHPHSCTKRTNNQEPIGDYWYCPHCTESGGGDEPNCCHPIVEKDPPHRKFAVGVCYGETGSEGCMLLGPCAWSNDTVAKCQGGLPPQGE